MPSLFCLNKKGPLESILTNNHKIGNNQNNSSEKINIEKTISKHLLIKCVSIISKGSFLGFKIGIVPKYSFVKFLL
jgi:TctA family transporter